MAVFSSPVFLGGGIGPWLPAWLWVLVKTAAVLAALVWLRYRILVPLTIAQAMVVALVVLGEGGV